ncbi:MAG: YbhN family protein [Bacteroidales bacterium]
MSLYRKVKNYFSRWAPQIKVILALILIFLLIRQVQFPKLVEVLKKAKLNYFLLGFSFFIILIASQALRLYSIVFKRISSLKNLVKVTFIAYFFNNFLPSSIGGDSYKILYIKNEGSNVTDSVSLVTLDRISGLFALFVIGCLALLLNFRNLMKLIRAGDLEVVKINYQLIIIVVACGLFLVGVMLLIDRYLFDSSFSGKIKEVFKDATNTLKRLRPYQYLLLIFFSLIVSFLRFLKFYFYLRCFGGQIGIFNLISVIIFMNFVALLPITFGGLGLKEGSIMFGLGVFGVDKSAGLMVGLIDRLAVWFISIIGGGLYMITNLNLKTDTNRIKK